MQQIRRSGGREGSEATGDLRARAAAGASPHVLATEPRRSPRRRGGARGALRGRRPVDG